MYTTVVVFGNLKKSFKPQKGTRNNKNRMRSGHGGLVGLWPTNSKNYSWHKKTSQISLKHVQLILLKCKIHSNEVKFLTNLI